MSRPASKFSGLLDAVQAPPPVEEPLEASSAGRPPAASRPPRDDSPPPIKTEPDRARGARRSAPDPTRDAAPSAIAPPAAAPRRRGRPAGKRSDPEYDQVTAYIRRQTYRDVRIALLTRGHEQEFSELVEELLAGWLATNR